MRVFTTAVACVALGVVSLTLAQQREQSGDEQRARQQDAQRDQQQQQQKQKQTIRGTVAGVTTIGEAIIDPVTNTAVVVQANYLTVLGAPGRGQGGRQQADSRGEGAQQDPGARRDASQQGEANRSRQNVYMVAITPETTIRAGQPGGQQQQQQPGREQSGRGAPGEQGQSQAAFDKLEIGDRVELEFTQTRQIRQQSGAQGQRQDQQAQDTTQARDGQRKTGFRGEQAASKHGRNRILVGEAETLTILPEQQGDAPRGEDSQRRRGSEQQRRQNEEQ